MANKVNLFGRPGGSEWASNTWVNVLQASTPSTMAGRTVAGVMEGKAQTPAAVLAEQVRMPPVTPGQSLGPAGTGDAGVVAPFKPPGMLVSNYASAAPGIRAQDVAQAQDKPPAPGDFSELVTQFKADPGSFDLTAEGIRDVSPDVSSRWNFGEMKAPDALVVHHTAGRGDAEGVIQTFTERNFPAHFVIDRDGNITQVLGLRQKGQHTRPAQDNSGITNSSSWGVEIIAKDDADVLPVQAAATLRLSRYLQTQGLNPQKIVGHGAINAHKQATEGETVVNLLRQING